MLKNIIQAKIISVLKLKRTQLASQMNIEPYKVLHNETIEIIAQKQPKAVEELFEIKGLGQKKILRYGTMILDTVKSIMNDKEASSSQQDKIYNVAEYLGTLNMELQRYTALIEGEISGEVQKRGGAVYYTLRDKREDAVLHCFSWRWEVEQIGIDLQEGMVIQVEGTPTIWPPTGRFRLQVKKILLTGEGELKRAFEQLKKKLAQEGLFDPAYKQILPRFIKTIGLITAAGREAQADFLTHLARRGIKVLFYDVRVEGIHAVDEIVQAIEWFNHYQAQSEVLVITRGGGGIESLQAFNSETLARAIFASKIPILTGVGHEKDITIADLVADVRASTPTHAAKIISQDWENAPRELYHVSKTLNVSALSLIQNIRGQLSALHEEIDSGVHTIFDTLSQTLNVYTSSWNSTFQRIFDQLRRIQLEFTSNQKILSLSLSHHHESRNHYVVILKNIVKKYFQSLKIKLIEAEKKLLLSSPTQKLKQGYSIVHGNLDKRIIKSTEQLHVGDKLKITFYQGEAGTKVEEIT